MRRRMFFEAKKVDLRSTYGGYYEKYKTLIAPNLPTGTLVL